MENPTYEELKPWISRETVKAIAEKHYPGEGRVGVEKTWLVIRGRRNKPELMTDIIDIVSKIRAEYNESVARLRE